MSNSAFCKSIENSISKIIAFFDTDNKQDVEEIKLGEILIAEKLATEEQIKQGLGQQKKLGEILIKQGVLSQKDLQKALDKQNRKLIAGHRKKSGRRTDKTIRIDQGKLDSFAESVGDLYINLDSVNFLKKRMENEGIPNSFISRFDNTIRSIDEIVEKLHDNIMSIRRVPLKALFQRFPRVIRQLADALEKKITFVIEGENTVIDKDLLEKIENPLVHILRNSVDHGIETPGERLAKNKPEQGTLLLRAEADENDVSILIIDDGRGIDPRLMAEIAEKKGFLPENEIAELTDAELVNLIFHPGFSSAGTVSDISGRGVGMDVVMSGLKQCNGTIDVKSGIDTGTTVYITIPLTKTLVTREAMIIGSGEHTFVIPSDDITTVIESDNIIPILGGEGMAYDGKILRLIDLDGFFSDGIPRDRTPGHTHFFALSLKHQVALMFDEVRGHQKIVAKDFPQGYEKLKNIEGISGYTVLGDDEIILIIDIERLATHPEA